MEKKKTDENFKITAFILSTAETNCHRTIHNCTLSAQKAKPFHIPTFMGMWYAKTRKIACATSFFFFKVSTRIALVC